MMDFLFFVKTFVLTIAIVLVMQIQVGQQTIETHAMGWVQNSAVTAPLNGVARGAAKAFRDVTTYVSSKVKKNTQKKKKEEARASSASQYEGQD